MARLSDLRAKNAKLGMNGDGAGLYLRVKPSGAKSWVLRVQHMGKRTDIGLGGFPADLSLAEAREKAAALRKLARQGVDARAERDKGKVRIPTFKEAMEEAHRELSKGDKWSDKTAAAFKSSMNDHVIPSIGATRVDSIHSDQVIAVLAPLWTDKSALAKKLRVRIMQVLQYAKAHRWRTDALPTPEEISFGLGKAAASTHFAAMPFASLPGFIAGQLAKEDTNGRLALLFTILTAARSGEVRAAKWEHIDLEERTWSRPASLMKMKVDHVVTLSEAAVGLLKRLGEGRTGLVFPGLRGKPLSDMTLTQIMRAGDRTETVHGFRSAFRDWAAEKMPTVPAMVAEMALAHKVGDATQQAYLRSDLRDMRRSLMDAWGRFAAPSLSPGSGNVVELAPRTAGAAAAAA